MSSTRQKLNRIETRLKPELEADEPLDIEIGDLKIHTTRREFTEYLREISRTGTGLQINQDPFGQNRTKPDTLRGQLWH